MTVQKVKSEQRKSKTSPKTPHEVIHECYLEYSKYSKDKYNWSIDEGCFNNVITWLIKSSLIHNLSIALLIEQSDMEGSKCKISKLKDSKQK